MTQLQNGSIERREDFLLVLSKKLGRERKKKVIRPKWSVTPQWDVLKDATQDELVNVLEEHCAAIHTQIIRTTSEHVHDALMETFSLYDAKSVITWDDERFQTYQLTPFLQKIHGLQEIEHVKWKHENSEASVMFAEGADIGLTFSDITLAESATVVLFSDQGKGRSVSLLPKTHVVLIPKSSIVPRLTQATAEISRRVQEGETIASCINFISGPSNSADIEMNLVVGVHGPLNATYIVVEDW